MINISVIAWCCVASIALALLGFLATYKFVNTTAMDKHQPFLDATLTIVGTLVSILLGLLVANSVDYYETMQAVSNNEASSVADVVRLARGLPTPTRLAITNLCIAYNQEVQYVEWTNMASRKMSAKAGLIYIGINDAVVTFLPTNNKDNNLQNALLSAVQQLGDYRHTRLMALQSTWCRRIMPVIALCSVVVLAYTYLYTRRDRRRLHALIISFVAISLGANIAMIFLLRNPFSTEWKIQPTGFHFNEELMKSYRRDYK